MVKIKICGIRLEREIMFLNQALPDYAGFVFSPSKRRVSQLQAKFLIRGLDKVIIPIGIFVNASLAEIAETAKTCKLKGVQLHGDEDESFIKDLRKIIPQGVEIWKAIKVANKDINIDNIKKNDMNLRFKKINLGEYPNLCDRILLDSAMPGSGKAFDYSLLPQSLNNFMLAGGLSPETVRETILKTHPYGVDVSSGVEGIDGYKDQKLIKAFIKNAREEKL